MKKDHISAADYKLLKTEHQIQTECINYLRAEGFYVQRMNSGVVSADYTYKTGYMKGMTKSRKLWLSDKGTPDIMAFIVQTHSTPDKYKYASMFLIFVEVKRPGKTITEPQRVTIQELTYHGAECFVVHSVEELESMLSSRYGQERSDPSRRVSNQG